MPGTVDAYLAAQPPAARKVLKQVRSLLRRALPGAEETLSYGIPAYRQHRRVVLYFAGWREHFSLYPVSRRLAQAMREELKPYAQSGRGTVRFPLGEKVPVRVITRFAKLRLNEVVEATRTRRKTAKRR